MERGKIIQSLVQVLEASFPAAKVIHGYPVLDADCPRPVTAGEPLIALREVKRTPTPAWTLLDETVFTQTIDSEVKTGTGSATAVASGTPTSTRTLIVEVVLGGEIGAATGQVSDDGGSTWTSPETLTSTFSLGHGIELAFTGGAGADFVTGDRWTVETTATRTDYNRTDEVRDLWQLDVLTATPDEFYGQYIDSPNVAGLDGKIEAWITTLCWVDANGVMPRVFGDRNESYRFTRQGGVTIAPSEGFNYFHFAYTLLGQGQYSQAVTQELVDGWNFTYVRP